MRTFILFFLFFSVFQSSASIADDELNYDISKTRFLELRQKTISGKANLAEIKEALRYPQKEELTNLIHSLYALRSYRPIYNLLIDLWNKNKSIDNTLAWNLISEAPVRIAIANNINRIKGNLAGKEFREYIRRFKYDEDVFIRSQSIIALGLNQNPQDIPYLVEMASSDNHYLIQVGISALSFMSHNKARDALKKLAKQYYGKPRGDLIIDVLDKAYGVKTSTTPLEG